MRTVSIAAIALAAAWMCSGAVAEDERVCTQSSYLPPCPKVIWCPGTSCGVGVPRADGDIEIVYATDRAMDGTRRRPLSNGQPLSLNHIADRVIVFEWDRDAKVPDPKTDLAIKDILYVVMPSGPR
jgi:hypothetical protein